MSILLFNFHCMTKVSFCCDALILMSSLFLLFNVKAGLHHGCVELAHLGGKHPGFPHRRRLCVICLGNVLHCSRNHHRLLWDSVLLLPC